MTDSTKAIMQTPQHFYQAIGTVEGTLDINDPNNTLTIGNRSFSVTVAKAARKKHQPQTTQCFRVYPGIKRGNTAFKVISVVDAVPTNFTLKGCWEIYEGEAFLVIYRNEISFPGGKPRSLVSVQWKDAPAPDGQFWELEAKLEGGHLVVIKADGPLDPPPKATYNQPPVKALTTNETLTKPALIAKAKPVATDAFPATTAQVQITAIPLTPQEIRDMATPAKISLTCKLNEIPAHRELPDKQVEFFLDDGSNRIFTVRVKPKMFKKLTDHGFAQWVAAISGELGPTTETGFELVNAAVQIFEKKAPADASAGQEKALATEAKTPTDKAAVAKPEPPKADAQAGAGKRKGLLEGVRLK